MFRFKNSSFIAQARTSLNVDKLPRLIWQFQKLGALLSERLPE